MKLWYCYILTTIFFKLLNFKYFNFRHQVKEKENLSFFLKKTRNN